MTGINSYRTTLTSGIGKDAGTKQDAPAPTQLRLMKAGPSPAASTQSTGVFASLTTTTLEPTADSHFHNEALAKLFGLSITEEPPAQGSEPRTPPTTEDGRPKEDSSRMLEAGLGETKSTKFVPMLPVPASLRRLGAGILPGATTGPSTKVAQKGRLDSAKDGSTGTTASVSVGGYAGQGISNQQLQPVGVKAAAATGKTTWRKEQRDIQQTAAPRDRLSHGRPSNPSATPLSPLPSPTPPFARPGPLSRGWK